MFDFNDPTKSAEDQMSDAFGCIVLMVIAALAIVIGAIILIVKAL